MKKPSVWTNVYPQGTKEGDEELKFFISLARNVKYQWRSISAISKEAGLTKERIEEIVAKYYKKGMVFQNPKNEDQWGYWERVPEMLPKSERTVSQKDHDDRINKSNKTCEMANGGFPQDGFPDNSLCQSPSNTAMTEEELNAHCAQQWGASGKNYSKGTPIPFDDCQIVHYRIGNDRKTFYVDIKGGDAEVFLIKMKEQFKNKKVKPASEWDKVWADVGPIERAKITQELSDEEYFRSILLTPLKLPK